MINSPQMMGKFLAILTILPLWTLARADTTLTTGAVSPTQAPSLAEFSLRKDPTMDWAKDLIEDFCVRMRADYGIKLKFADFAENGSRDQVIQFAAEVSASQADMDSFCEHMARKLNPRFQGKVRSKTVANSQR